MGDIITKYPVTDLHSVNLDYILKVVRENAGLHLEVSGNQLLMKTADNTIISAITIPYATSAGSANTASSASYASTAGSAASAQYAATSGTATTATNATNATHATSADTATSAASAASATNADHATSADSATYATSAGSATTADYATSTGSVDHAKKAFESVEANGSYTRFTTGDGTTTDFQIPFALKAYRDNSNNIITTTYVANVTFENGTFNFKNAQGNTIVTITPTSNTAELDSYGNTIADYIKSIVQAAGSNYVTVTHGNGTVDTIQIHYSDTAWKDTNGNVIKNTYIKRLEIITDPNDGHKKLVAYNGDDPEAELFRFEVEAYSAQVAAEATHAASADYATNAGNAATADTATTSTGSVSSISSPSNERQYLEITNGDGTIKKFNIALWNISFQFIEDVNQTNIFDNAFTVGHDEEYEIRTVDLNKYGYTNVYDVLDEGTYIELLSNGHEVMFSTPIQSNKTALGGYIITVFNPDTVALEVFNIQPGNDNQHIKLTRLL